MEQALLPPVTLEDIREYIRRIRDFLTDLDLNRLTGPEAERILDAFSKVERVAVAGKMLVAPIIEESLIWRDEGHRSATSYLAERTGTTNGEAASVLETAAALAELPETAAALHYGQISAKQAEAIGSAASTHPAAEGELLEMAGRMSLKGLKRKCDGIKSLSSFEADEVGRYNAIRQRRFLRHWRDVDGGFRLEAKLTPDGGARLLEAVRAKAQVFFDGAREKGIYESAAAYAADGLVSLADDAMLGSGTGIGRPHVTLRVDLASLRRGETEGNEVCEIPGVGPVPLAVANRMLSDSFVKIVVTDGVDVQSVSHVGRSVPVHMMTALEERDRCCVVPGCDSLDYLEVHHLVPFAQGGPTSLDNLVRICRWHHDLLTYEGWCLERECGGWAWHPPPDLARLDTEPGDRTGEGAASRSTQDQPTFEQLE